MKLFHATVSRPHVYLGSPNGGGSCDIAWVKFREAIVVAADQERADKKIRATLPPEDQKTKTALLMNNINGEYYSIGFRELTGMDGVYFC